MNDDTDLTKLPPSPPLLERDRVAAHLRAIEQGLAEGHVEWAREGVAFLAQEFELDCAMLEHHRLKIEHFYERTPYAPH
jgi:hypothetical protein